MPVVVTHHDQIDLDPDYPYVVIVNTVTVPGKTIFAAGARVCLRDQLEEGGYVLVDMPRSPSITLDGDTVTFRNQAGQGSRISLVDIWTSHWEDEA